MKKDMRRLLPLGLLLIFVWTLMLLASYGVSILVANPQPILGRLDGAMLGIYRVVVGGAIFLIWLWIWKKAAERYFEAFFKRRKPQ